MAEAVLVCGDRNWAYDFQKNRGWKRGDNVPVATSAREDYVLLIDTLDRLHEEIGIDLIIEGDAPGADQLAGFWSRLRKVPNSSFPAKWAQYGRAAGPIRNTQMLEALLAYEGPKRVVAFHRSLGSSKGTANMIAQASEQNLPIEVYP